MLPGNVSAVQAGQEWGLLCRLYLLLKAVRVAGCTGAAGVGSLTEQAWGFGILARGCEGSARPLSVSIAGAVLHKCLCLIQQSVRKVQILAHTIIARWQSQSLALAFSRRDLLQARCVDCHIYTGLSAACCLIAIQGCLSAFPELNMHPSALQ